MIFRFNFKRALRPFFYKDLKATQFIKFIAPTNPDISDLILQKAAPAGAVFANAGDDIFLVFPEE